MHSLATEHSTNSGDLCRVGSFDGIFNIYLRTDAGAKWMGEARSHSLHTREIFLYSKSALCTSHTSRCSISNMCCAITMCRCRALNDILIQTIMQLKSNREMKASIHRRFDFVPMKSCLSLRPKFIAFASHTHTHTHRTATFPVKWPTHAFSWSVTVLQWC